jgi:hypothetical protein
MRVRSCLVTWKFLTVTNLGPTDSEHSLNKEIPGIIQELEDLASEGHSDAFLLYL